MNRKSLLMFIIATLSVMSCGKKEARNESPAVVVKTQSVVAQSLDGARTYSATIEETAGTALSFPLGGTVKQVLVSEGQMVKAGAVIAVVDASSQRNGYDMATAATSQAEETLKQAEDSYRRLKMLHDNGSLPEIQWVEVQTKLSQAQGMVRQAKAAEAIAKKGVSDARLIAPFSGYIAQRAVEAGQNVLPGQMVAKLVRIDNVKVNMSVPESEISKISVGQKVSIRVEALDNRQYTGTICEKAVSANPLSRAYEVKALVNNSDLRLLPGMVCVSSLGQGGGVMGLTVPLEVVQIDSDNRHFVWTVTKGKAHKTYISTGQTLGERVCVSQGLSEGQQLIVEGQQKVSEGMSVTAK
ncbi:MAG: efflux RND transporter periplasmic adaptor subunit [Alloprevotella sp.]|nr:efflux RND transporter periplasmic adaptor subunit [Bacteroidales bacterium]MDY3942744.1 efflux RND transporter periplasmic adaptor subunit [Alloprevotella sp.]